MDEPRKKCRGPCGNTYPLFWYRRNAKSKDGHENVCKVCRAGQDRISALRRRYGLTYDEWVELLRKQDYRCAICRQAPGKGLQVDHCHTTGKVRGLLCGPCNRALGLLQDDPHVIARAAVFVAQNQEIEE